LSGKIRQNFPDIFSPLFLQLRTSPEWVLTSERCCSRLNLDYTTYINGEKVLEVIIHEDHDANNLKKLHDVYSQYVYENTDDYFDISDTDGNWVNNAICLIKTDPFPMDGVKFDVTCLPDGPADLTTSDCYAVEYKSEPELRAASETRSKGNKERSKGEMERKTGARKNAKSKDREENIEQEEKTNKEEPNEEGGTPKFDVSWKYNSWHRDLTKSHHEVSVVSDGVCDDADFNWESQANWDFEKSNELNYDSNTHLCVDNRNSDQISGIGGALMCIENGEPVLRGILSWIDQPGMNRLGCYRPKYYRCLLKIQPIDLFTE